MTRINGFVGRRDVLKWVGAMSIGTSFAGCNLMGSKQSDVASDVDTVNAQPINANAALKRLLDGNQRFIQQRSEYPDQSLQRLRLVAKAQYPFASILGCADSRVPAEIVFDQGLGDLFVVRVAGNVANDMTIASLEYSTAILGSQLIMVLGHRRCGAVAAAIKNEATPGKIGLIVESIKPAVSRVKSRTGDINENAVIANIKYQAEKLQKNSAMLKKFIGAGKLKIVGAVYDIDTGKVNIIT